jgi:uncharacterized protein YbjT (DUF2867 family)
MSGARGRVLILGADGFIGRHLAFGLRAQGWEVLASARRVTRLRRMGFEVLKADLAHRKAETPGFWRPHLRGVTHVVNAAGVLSAPAHIAEAVHVTAPEALYQVLPKGAGGLLISAVGIEGAKTEFARYRLAGEEVAGRYGVTILRAGLVLGETSYGGSSLARGLAALPFLTPVVGRGDQAFNPVHVADLAAAVDQFLIHPPGAEIQEIGGPETVTQAEMLRAMRGWLGLRRVPLLRLPLGLARAMGRLGDAMRLGPISATAVAQLEQGVVAQPGETITTLPRPPRGFSRFLSARPAGTQDLWHARLYLMRPLVRVALAFLWLTSGLLGLFLPSDTFLPLIEGAPLSDQVLILLARAGGVADLAIASALLRGWRPRLMAGLQAAMVLGYTLAFTVLAPALWLLPLGGLLKNLLILVLIAVMAILEDER